MVSSPDGDKSNSERETLVFMFFFQLFLILHDIIGKSTLSASGLNDED